MKRRTFIKFLAGLPLIGSLPVLAKTTKGFIADKPVEIAFDGTSDYLKANAFTLDEPQTVTMWHDLTGNGNHLVNPDPHFAPWKVKKLRVFDATHTEKEIDKIAEAMERGEPESYYKRFRGYRPSE